MRGFLVLLGFLATAAVPAAAGMICGTVRDADTGFPVPQAGIFVRETTGAYTGLHAASDSAGAFCVEDVPAGTYDIEVCRDDYAVAYVTGVEVTDGTVGVEVDARPARLAVRAVPNPARSSVRLSVQGAEPTQITVEVFDLRGRRLRAWAGAGVSAEVSWDFRDGTGREVPPGAYFVRVRQGDTARGLKILRVR